MASSKEIIDEICKELWGVIGCYDAVPQELIGSLISVTAHICKIFDVTQEQAVQIFSNTWDNMEQRIENDKQKTP